MNKEEIIKVMENRGFTLWSTSNGGDTLTFLTNPEGVTDPDLAINCIVKISTLEFEFKYLVPKSQLVLSLGTCSPVNNNEFFVKKLLSFSRGVSTLHAEFTREGCN